MYRWTVHEKYDKIMSFCRKIRELLEDLKNEAMNFIIRDKIVELFSRDANSVVEKYKKNAISRKEAMLQLQDLEATADKLEEYVSNVKGILLELREHCNSVLKGLTEPPLVGVPIGVVKGKIKRLINQVRSVSLPKREFGILNILKGEKVDEKVKEFVDEYSSGLIITGPELRNSVEKALEDVHVTFEVKEVGKRVVFMIGVSH